MNLHRINDTKALFANGFLAPFLTAPTDEIWSGAETKLRDAESQVSPEIDLSDLQSAVEEALSIPAANTREIDALTAIHFHSSLRLLPCQAADPGIWSWLSFRMFPKFTRHRWHRNDKTSDVRYLPNLKRNSFAAPWWLGEITSIDGDYSYTEMCTSSSASTDLIQQIMDNRFGNCAHLCHAFIRCFSSKTGEDIKEAAKKINCLLTVFSVDTLESVDQAESLLKAELEEYF